MKLLSIVLPTYNERDNLEGFVEEILAEEKRLSGYRVSIVIADSHSEDGTGEVARRLAERNKYIHFIDVGPGMGVGLYEGHRYALEYIKPEILMQLDADGQVDVSVISRLVRVIEEGYDLALGSRFVAGGRNELPFSRRFFSMGSSLVCRFVMGPWEVREFTNSARAFTPELFGRINWERLPWRRRTFIVHPAFLHESILAGARYKEVPLVFKNRAQGYSKNKIVRYTRDILVYTVLARLQSLGMV